MDPFFNHSKEERCQEAQIENIEEQGRRISEEKDPSSLIQGSCSFIIFSEEIHSGENTSPNPIMNLSASHESLAPLITLEQCKRAISEHPSAGNLIIQRGASETGSTVKPPTFHDHFISAFPAGLMSGEKDPDQEIAQKSRLITKELFGLLQQEYGKKIADASFPSAPHRIAIAHPLSTKDLDAILTTAEVLAKQEIDFSSLETDPQVQLFTQEAQIADANVARTTKAAQKKNAFFDKKNDIAQQGASLYEAHLGSSVFRLVSLEKDASAAHKKAIAVKDRLAIARGNAFQKEEESYQPSEGISLLSRKNNGENYQSISQNTN